MRSRGLVSFSASFALLPMSILGQGAVEGRVGLPELHTAAPVVVKRYEIVTRGGVLSTQPPLAVVYLEGSFSKPKSQPVKQVAQKNLEFVPPLLPVQVNTRVEFPTSMTPITVYFPTLPRNGSISVVIVRKSVRSRPKFLTEQAWSRFGVIFTSTC